LAGQGIDVFMPMLAPRRGGAPSPLFPRYLFARFDLAASLAAIRYTRGVHRVVGCGDMPVPIDDDIVRLIRARLDADGLMRPRPALLAGDPVIIEDGPLKDLVGIFERPMRGSERVSILLTAVHCQPRVAVDREAVRRLDAGSAR
jgi:transcription antitermination factor NusG